MLGHRRFCGSVACLCPQDIEEQSLDRLPTILAEREYWQSVKDEEKYVHKAHLSPTFQEQPLSEPSLDRRYYLCQYLRSIFIQLEIRREPHSMNADGTVSLPEEP